MGRQSNKSGEQFTRSEERANTTVSNWWKQLVEDMSEQHAEIMESTGLGTRIVPKSRRVAETRNELPKMLKEVDQGEAFLIRGPKGREALMIDADVFRSLQEAYFALLGELETRNILDNAEAKKSLDDALESDDYVTFSEAEDLDAE
jgi:hypothetical protein